MCRGGGAGIVHACMGGCGKFVAPLRVDVQVYVWYRPAWVQWNLGSTWVVCTSVCVVQTCLGAMELGLHMGGMKFRITERVDRDRTVHLSTRWERTSELHVFARWI